MPALALPQYRPAGPRGAAEDFGVARFIPAFLDGNRSSASSPYPFIMSPKHESCVYASGEKFAKNDVKNRVDSPGRTTSDCLCPFKIF